MKKLLLASVLLTGTLFAQSAEEIIQDNGCLACHAVASKKAAPAFAGIGKRNQRFEGDSAKEVIMASIKNGSQGKYPYFSDSAMPAFPNLTQEQLSTVADYILSQSSKARGRGGSKPFLIQNPGLPHLAMLVKKMWDSKELALTPEQKKNF